MLILGILIAISRAVISKVESISFLHMKQVYQSPVMALHRGQESKVISTPDSGQIVETDDCLIAISKAAPQMAST